MIEDRPWRYQDRERFGTLHNLLLTWRAAVLLLGCGVPSAIYLWMERILYREALAGRALEIRDPQLALVLGVAACGAVGLVAAGVLYLMVMEPRAGLIAAVMHDGLQIALLAGAVVLMWPDLPGLAGDARTSLGGCALATGLFAAEAVLVCLWRRWRVCAGVFAAAYLVTVGALGVAG